MMTLIRAHSYQCTECLATYEQTIDAHSKILTLKHPESFIPYTECHLAGKTCFMKPDYVAVESNGRAHEVQPIA